MTHDKKKEKHDSHHEEDLEAITLPKAEYDDLQKRAAELEAMKDRLSRAAADFENAKKRLARERDEFVKFSQENLIRDLLPVLDNFERALAHAGEGSETSLKNIVSGVERVRKQLFDALKGQGLKKLQTVGEKFDPHLHEAVGVVHESGPEEIIVAEVEPGYTLQERLLRPAKVRIRMAPPSEEKQDEIT